MRDRYVSSWSAIGPAIHDYRVAAGLTQAELADAAGVSRAWVNALENGAPNASAALVWQVLATLKLHVILTAAPEPDSTLAIILGEQP